MDSNEKLERRFGKNVTVDLILILDWIKTRSGVNDYLKALQIVQSEKDVFEIIIELKNYLHELGLSDPTGYKYRFSPLPVRAPFVPAGNLEELENTVISYRETISLESTKSKKFLFLANSLFSDEEIVSSLVALLKQLKSENKPNWLILIIVSRHILELIWGVHIQMRIDNITLSKRKVDK